ncbi:TetR family transcriptional regulator [Actinocrinis puniceicyclus]|uniref:TetR family transcriptional regulator n=1 Tax=Actinocrinis puniceicyclus TaxID=977794 RepID=A0A8J7WQM7_9ACTN|nr:TetR family transcriptional regulator [Actinocrinis puniceicyclus]MBS2963720.1 TetR family transcriptional regulator [Actinocrinis puniceicyclus]
MSTTAPEPGRAAGAASAAPTDDRPHPVRHFTDRSAQTRAAILAAARARFAADGYEKATIRAIAADAGIDASMVIRYYGSKAQLFEASAAIDLALRETVAADAGPERVAQDYAHAFMTRWESGTNEVEQLLIRTAFTHKDAIGQVQRIFDEQIKPPILAALAGDADAELRAALVMTQTLGLAICRYLLRLNPIAAADPADLERAVRDAVRMHLTRPMRDEE